MGQGREKKAAPLTRGQGGLRSLRPCPYRKGPPESEEPNARREQVWFDVLQDKRFAGLKFTRQKPLVKYIVDFYCAALMLAIEIDGDSHMEQDAYDGQRTSRLNQLGVEVIRYASQEILTNLDTVYEDLSKRMQRRRDEPPKSPLSGGMFTPCRP